MRYTHTTIDSASWVDEPLDGPYPDELLTSTLNFVHQNLMQEIDIQVTVG